jgi:hypothetical protein
MNYRSLGYLISLKICSRSFLVLSDFFTKFIRTWVIAKCIEQFDLNGEADLLNFYKQEVLACNTAAEKYPRNYYAWKFRGHIFQTFRKFDAIAKNVLYPLSSILYPLSSILYPLSSILYPLSSPLLSSPLLSSPLLSSPLLSPPLSNQKLGDLL